MTASNPLHQPAEFGSWRVPEPVAAQPWFTRRDARIAAITVAVLAVAGVGLGVLWQWWAPARPAAYVIGPGLIQPDETESFVAADGRYALLITGIGLIAGVVAYSIRRTRGPMMAVGLFVGGLVGGVITELVGYLLGGGQADGATNTIIEHLRLHVHTGSLRLVEPMAALLAYSILVAFAHRDDLGVAVDGGPRHSDGSQPVDSVGMSHQT